MSKANDSGWVSELCECRPSAVFKRLRESVKSDVSAATDNGVPAGFRDVDAGEFLAWLNVPNGPGRAFRLQPDNTIAVVNLPRPGSSGPTILQVRPELSDRGECYLKSIRGDNRTFTFLAFRIAALADLFSQARGR